MLMFLHFKIYKFSISFKEETLMFTAETLQLSFTSG